MGPRRTAAGLALALLAAAAVALAPPPAGLEPAGQHALAIGVFAAVCWVTGALPLAVTSLCVPILLTALGVYPRLAPALEGFADPVVFLLLAGFALATALDVHDLDRRLALWLLARVASGPRRLVLAVMVVTAALSAVVSNTATAATMAPVALGLVAAVDPPRPEEGPPNLEVATLLGVAYGASVGGVATLVGTPPNAIVAAQVESLLGYELDFVTWLALGLPLAVVMLPLVWAVLVAVFPPADVDVAAARRAARQDLRAMGPLDRPARRTVAVFVATVGLWVLGGLGTLLHGVLPARLYATLYGGAGPTLLGTGPHQGLLFYVLVGLLAVPALVVAGCASWDDLAAGVDWSTLVLLGGGVALADALTASGAVAWLADAALGALGGAPLVLVVAWAVALTIAVGELASNTAMAAVLAPLLVTAGGAYAAALGVSAQLASVFLAVGGALAASFGFALPVATPPNAIVYGTGRVSRAHMLRAGLPLDAIAAAALTAFLWVAYRAVWPLLL